MAFRPLRRCRSPSASLAAAACASLARRRPRRRRRTACPPRAPSPDPRVGLKAGLMNAGEAVWNLRVVSQTPPSPQFVGITNSDLAFTGNYAIQGSYNGYQVWDISNPRKPTLKTAYVCPGVAERRLGLQEPALRLRRGPRRRGSTAAPRA